MHTCVEEKQKEQETDRQDRKCLERERESDMGEETVRGMPEVSVLRFLKILSIMLNLGQQSHSSHSEKSEFKSPSRRECS